MTLLTPLGLLGLIGLLGWLIIYLIKPNFQQKFISSTYVWKLSLKYRRKKLPVNKLRNILLIVCQLLILIACATILARPVEVLKNQVEVREVIAIIDSSASMRTNIKGETRFHRAIDVEGRGLRIRYLCGSEVDLLGGTRIEGISRNAL